MASRIPTSSRLPIAALALAGLAVSLLVIAEVRAQDPGDKVVMTLKSGQKYTVELISKTADKVKVKLGDTEMELPSAMVVSLEKIESAPAPVPTPAPTPTPAASPSAGGKTPPGDSSEGPSPATITLKDGTTVSAYILKKDARKVWVIAGTPVALDASEVDHIDAQGGGSGEVDAFSSGGVSLDRARKFVEDMSSDDRARSRAAMAAIDAMEADGYPALVEGLKSPKKDVRVLCIMTLGRHRPDIGVKPVLDVLKGDAEESVRITAAQAFNGWNGPGVRKALLSAARDDPSIHLRTTAFGSLALNSGPEEVEELLGFLSGAMPEDPTYLTNLYNALRHASEQRMGNDPGIWKTWWAEGGKDAIAAKIQEIQSERTFAR